ncbi:MAG: hypothetical protein L0H83_13270 [Salinisphaera sp.]|nr:hypothetical protein [Salinisphaera sp.]
MSRHLGFRAEDALAQAVRLAAQRSRTRLSDYIRQALREKIDRDAARGEPTPFALGKDLFGRYGSGDGGLSVAAGERMRRGLAARRESEKP